MGTTADELSAWLAQRTGAPPAPSATQGDSVARPTSGSPLAAARALVPQYQDAMKGVRLAAADPAALEGLRKGREGVESAIDGVSRAAALKPDLQVEPAVPELRIRQIGAKRAFAALMLGAIAGRAGGTGGWETAAKALSGTMQAWRNGQIDKVQSGLTQYKTQVEAVKRRNAEANAELDRIQKLAETNLTLAQAHMELYRATYADGMQQAAAGVKSLQDQIKLYSDVNKLENDEADRHLAYQKYLDEHAKAPLERQRTQAEAELTAEKLRRVKAGLPETPKADTGDKLGIYESGHVTRTTVAAHQAITDLQNIVNLSAATGGVPGAFFHSEGKGGIFGSLGDYAGTKLNSEEQNAYKQYVSNMARSLAFMESAGFAVPKGAIEELKQNVESTSALDRVTAYQTLANAKQQMVAAIDGLIAGPTYQKPAAAAAVQSLQELRAQAELAVPYDNNQINEWRASKTREPFDRWWSKKYGDGGALLNPSYDTGAAKPFDDPEKERRYQEWKRTHGAQ